MPTKILIIGAHGQLARNTTRVFLRDTDAKLTLHLRRATRLKNPDPSRVTIVEGDVLDRSALEVAGAVYKRTCLWVDTSKWLDRVPALIETWYAGQESGTAPGEMLSGAFSPSGKLPATFERRWEDNAVYRSYYPVRDNNVIYSEGIFVGYRHFDQSGRKPLFPFGYGLSYTKFKLGSLAVTPDTLAGDGPVTVAFDVTNVGRREGAEVVQVYVGDRHAPVPRPPKELKGFVKVTLKPGESKRAQVTLNRRAFSYYDVVAKQWTAAPGEFDILVGASSQQIDLRGHVQLRGN